ncbi:DUF916 domain-containing protein [Companilactobacillus heilongjiangensis]|uniref:Uncharacterized protein n=1 Tax=Companilactobacillus heilongjiangensis TaxID=1074467 RepID=A0A0K2LDZ9_9LACO|nr:DUF916 domain-containing protein [Companilactobacillus heilongjiangensis]ALB29526.1 hypothetical protein JP39_09285 [Companilactobacillus heilongjiangensis]
MKKKFIVFFSALLLLITTLLPFATTVKAAPDKSYAIQAILPDNQVNKDESYFDLKVTPNKEQTLKVLIANTGSKPITVTAEVNNAYTADSGVIGYDKYNTKLYKSKLPSLTSLVEGKRKKVVTLANGENKTVEFKVKSPSSEYAGIILGGVTTTASVSPTKSKNINIKNQVRYVKGVVLRSKDDGVMPDMHLTSAAPKAVAGSTGIAYKLDNTAPINVNKVSLKAEITNGSKVTNYSADNLQFAPNSQFDYFIPIKKLDAGTYKAHISLKNESGFAKEFNYTITVKQRQVENVNDAARPKPQSHNKQWIGIIIGIIVLLGVVVWMYLYYSQRNKGDGPKGGRGKMNLRLPKKPDNPNKTSRSGNDGESRSSRHKK